MFLQESLRLRQSNLVAIDFSELVGDEYGISYNDPIPNDEGVEIPASRFSLPPEQLHRLWDVVNPIRESDDYSINLYMATLDFLRSQYLYKVSVINLYIIFFIEKN